MKRFVFFLFVIVNCSLFAQHFKIYNNNDLDVFSGFSDIISRNDSVMVIGGSGENPIRSPLLVSSVNSDGTLTEFFSEDNDTTVQLTINNGLKLITNSQDNYGTFFMDLQPGNLNLKYCEFNDQGIKVRDSVFFELNELFDINIVNKVEFIYDSIENNYLVCIMSSQVIVSGDVQNKVLILKITENLNIIDSHLVAISNDWFSYYVGNLIQRNNGNILLTYNSSINSGNSASNTAYLNILEFNQSFNVVNDYVYNTSQVCTGGLGLVDLDTAIVFEVKNSIFDGLNRFYNLNLVCFDLLNENEFWVKEISGYIYTQEFSGYEINDLLLDNNGNIVFGLTRGFENNGIYTSALEIQNRNLKGDVNWIRQMSPNFVDEIPYTNNKIIQNEDGDYFGCGRSFNGTLFFQNLPFQFAYTFKINCLGFIEDPFIDIEHLLYENNLTLYNNSKNFDSLQIDFGDGNIKKYKNTSDTIIYNYVSSGEYEVVISPLVCNPDLDTTVIFKIEVESKIDKPISANIYPNPIHNGVLYVHTDNKLGELIIVDMSGKVVYKEFINNVNETTILNLELSSGTYYLNFEANKISSQKFILFE